jgi:hypothetical protein
MQFNVDYKRFFTDYEAIVKRAWEIAKVMIEITRDDCTCDDYEFNEASIGFNEQNIIFEWNPEWHENEEIHIPWKYLYREIAVVRRIVLIKHFRLKRKMREASFIERQKREEANRKLRQEQLEMWKKLNKKWR